MWQNRLFFQECKEESECKLPISSGAGSGVTFLGTGVKKVTLITSAVLQSRGGQNHFFRLRLRWGYKIFESGSGSGNFSNV